jgi:CheY-like chemotaxis protein/HPt (histidine-containing phosphotransfer) domain-containing protein
MLMAPQNNFMEYDSINTIGAPHHMSKFVEITNSPADGKAEFNASVLVAEDDIVNQDVTQLILEVLGCRAALARNGIEAVEMAQKEQYDLILMDCQMPEMDGYEATRLIREQEKNAVSGNGHHVTVVALTGGSTEVSLENCKKFGMDDYLGKPFNVEQLRALLLKWLPDEQKKETSVERNNSVAAKVCTLDEKQLNTIRSLQREGAPDILEKVVDHYFSEAPGFIRKLREAVLADEAGVIRSIAHSFKSSSANLGALRLADYCREMESFGLNNEMTRTREIMEKIEEEYVSVSVALSAVRQGVEK